MVVFRAEQERYNLRPPAAARGYGLDWQALRNAILAAEPHCRHCARRGIERLAQMVDHIEPIRTAPERRLDPTNCQPLCWPVIGARPTAAMAVSGMHPRVMAVSIDGGAC